MRQKVQGYKKPCAVGVKQVTFLRMSTDLTYDHVSPARYPNPGRKRKSTKSPHPAGRKKKEKENKTPVIQHMTPIGLEDPSPEDYDPVVREVVEETRAAVEEMMKELNGMVDQTTQTPPPQYTVTNVYDKAEAFAEAQDPMPPPPSSVDYMVCPCHDVRLEARQSQKGWHYVKCPMQPCLLFSGQDQAYDYMKAVYCQPHPEVCDMWSCLQCFCHEPATLQQSHSPQNPDRLFVTCSKKKCRFFRWADQPLGPKYWTWFHDHPPKKADQLAEPPLPSRDADGYP